MNSYEVEISFSNVEIVTIKANNRKEAKRKANNYYFYSVNTSSIDIDFVEIKTGPPDEPTFEEKQQALEKLGQKRLLGL